MVAEKIKVLEHPDFGRCVGSCITNNEQRITNTSFVIRFPFLAPLLAMTGFLLGLIVGCEKQPVVGPTLSSPAFDRPLPTGTAALRKLTSADQIPDFTNAYLAQDPSLYGAMERSLDWFDKPSARQYFPIAGITHEQAQASLFAFAWILDSSNSPTQFAEWILDEFDVYTSVGWNGEGDVLFTGYYTPVFEGSRRRTALHQFPLHTRPVDLVTDPATGHVLGQRAGYRIVRYPTRRELHDSDLLAGTELVWLRNPLDAYLIHVQGSARLILTDGTNMHVGYDGTNGHTYTSIGQLLVRDGQIAREQLSLDALRSYFGRHPDKLDRYLLRNDRFIFFREYTGENWPAGSLGLTVTPLRSLATDKQVFPRGGVTLVLTPIAAVNSSGRHFSQFMLDQDTGGAIRAAGRADIYMGIGPDAERLAGQQRAVGRLFYCFLKPVRVAPWLQTMHRLR